jgi:hypothetical protein
MYISGQTISPLRSTMSSIDGPSSSLAPGTSVTVPSAIIPHALTPTRSVLSVHKNIHVEEIELSEVNDKPSQQKRSNLDVHVSPTNKSLKSREKIQFFALCWSLFLLGWCDSSTGPLLPRIQNVYHVLCCLSAPGLIHIMKKRPSIGWLHCCFTNFYSKLHCAPSK